MRSSTNPAALLICAVVFTGCGSPAEREPAPRTLDDLVEQSSEDPSQLEIEETGLEDPSADPALGRFLDDLTLAEAERRAAARAEVSLARRLMKDLDWKGASAALERAVIADPSNPEARRLLERLQFALGQREGVIAMVGDELADSERVRREQLRIELGRLYQEAEAAMAAKEFAKAEKLYDRLLQRLELIEPR
ncbi:MAG: hypothetical protein AAF488_13415 [Planctomycetota bacterium]